MNLEFYKTSNPKTNTAISIVCRIIRRLFKIGGESFSGKKVDEVSNGHASKKQLRCAISTCFDKGNICCKACDVKDCPYKCNFADKEVCEYEYYE